MYENMIKEIVKNNIEETLKKASKLSQEISSIYHRMSIDLNIQGISNKILNTDDLYGILNHYFLLVKVSGNNEYYLVDLDLIKKIIKIDDELFNEYLNNLGIANNNLTLEEIYEKKSNAR